jgi:hypothetical protein
MWICCKLDIIKASLEAGGGLLAVFSSCINYLGIFGEIARSW